MSGRFRVAANVAAAFLAAVCSPGEGASWTEIGDAGQQPATAQAVLGVGLLDTITGVIGNEGLDVDMYRIWVTSTASTRSFSARVEIPSGGNLLLDPQLFLFTAAGVGVYATDGINSSTLPANNPLTPTAPAEYLLAVSP
jgi:hypothetical protein